MAPSFPETESSACNLSSSSAPILNGLLLDWLAGATVQMTPALPVFPANRHSFAPAIVDVG
jgi:hypothetical protein